jgi:phage FluMu protein Com
MPNYKAIRCFHCDSVILSNMPNIVPHPSGNTHLCTLRCPVCSAITLQVNVSELKRYSMSRDIRERGYAKKGEWGEIVR